MRLPLDLFTDSDFSDENLPLLPARASEIAQKCCNGKKRSENENFWVAARLLLGGISSTARIRGPGPDSRAAKHNFYPAEEIIRENDITDYHDIEELKFQAAVIEVWCDIDPVQAASKHKVKDKDTQERFKLKVTEIHELQDKSPDLRTALKWVYRGKKPSEIFSPGTIFYEEDRRVASLKAALFHVQRGAFLENAIGHADVYDAKDEDRVRFFHGFQSILEGVPTLTAIKLCKPKHPGYVSALKKVGEDLDRLESRKRKRGSDGGDEKRSSKNRRGLHIVGVQPPKPSYMSVGSGSESLGSDVAKTADTVELPLAAQDRRAITVPGAARSRSVTPARNNSRHAEVGQSR